MRRMIIVFCAIGFVHQAGLAASRSARHGEGALFVASPSVEGENPSVTNLRIEVAGKESVDGREMVWWEMAAKLRDGGSYGVRILSERAAMTDVAGVGRIERYIYRDAAGKVLEYQDAATGKALLPAIQFERSFLPRPAADAVYDDGFASAGSFLGHVLVRVPRHEEPLPLSFDNATILRLRNDLIIGPNGLHREDPKAPVKEEKYRPCTREEVEAQMAAGMNFFGPGNDEQLSWFIDKPVFFRTTPTFPDTFYRSNWIPGAMFIDEPSVRLGWSGGIPANATGPEQVAEAMRQRVASHYTLERRQIKLANKADPGTLDLYYPNAVSWDTDYWSAWYQYAAGAPAVVHEGRYIGRGYGWEPEQLYGPEGLENLTNEDQYHCLLAFLRGAARAFGGDWGTSVYPEGDPKMRVPAMSKAYDMGARHLWFWTFAPNMSYDVELEVTRGVVKYASEHPRDRNTAAKAGQVGIALPAGCVFSWSGTWGMQREQRSRGGASFGDISAVAMWEGILCSRSGVPFDFLVDEPRIRDLGYERLVIVRTDGSMEAVPPWPQARGAKGLELSLDDGPVADVGKRDDGRAEYVVDRAADVKIDGDLGDWSDAKWISLNWSQNGFPDMTETQVEVVNDLSQDRWKMHFTRYMGMTFEQTTPDLEKKYVLEDAGGLGVVVTSVEANSPAARAGVLEGDLIVEADGWPIKWQFQMHQRLERYRDRDDGKRISMKLRRSGRYLYTKSSDLAAEVAMAVDDKDLYLAARVTDDVHNQPHYASDFWRGDCIQIGFDPTLERRNDGQYGEEDPEIGFVFQDEHAMAWRWNGRRGQPLGRMDNARVGIVRREGQTLYEAAVPLSELMPMSPDLWPECGFDIVVNDSDSGRVRKGRLELRPTAMTRGKRTAGFASMRFTPSPASDKLSAAILWRRRATQEEGFFRAVVAVRSPQATLAGVSAELQSLDSPETPPVKARIAMPVSSQAVERSLRMATQSPPGRYRLTITVEDAQNRLCARDSLPVYIYPAKR